MHIGDKWLSHCKYIFKMRVESADSLSLIELGSRMRSQTRLSVNVHEKRSALHWLMSNLNQLAIDGDCRVRWFASENEGV